MSAERKYNYYIDGSNVRQLNTAPDYDRSVRPGERQREEFERRQRERDNRQKQRERASRLRGMDLLAFLTYSVAFFAIAFLAINYLRVQGEIKASAKTLSTLETQVMKLADENKVISDSKDVPLNMDLLYEIATGTFGMVLPEENQVISYETDDNGYVKQYGEIPTNGELNLYEKLAGK